MIEAAQNRDHYPYMHMDDYSSGGFAIRSSKYIDLKYVAVIVIVFDIYICCDEEYNNQI